MSDPDPVEVHAAIVTDAAGRIDFTSWRPLPANDEALTWGKRMIRSRYGIVTEPVRLEWIHHAIQQPNARPPVPAYEADEREKSAFVAGFIAAGGPGADAAGLAESYMGCMRHHRGEQP